MLKKSLSVAAILALITGTIDARGMGQGNGHGYGKYKNSNSESRQASKRYRQSNKRMGRHGSQEKDRDIKCDTFDTNSSTITSIDTTSCNTACNTSDVNNTTTPDNTVLSNVSEELANTLSYMGNEERLAYDVYNKLYTEWGTKQFTNIASKSEVKHIAAVQQLVQKYKLSDDMNFTNVDLPALGYINTSVENMEAGTYDISEIQALYDDLIAQGSTSEIDALKVGCMVEVIDINDLNKYITIAEESNASDVLDVFDFLRKGSYNHYWAFDKGLKNKGVSEGCCALGTVDGVNYCHPEYPQNENKNAGQGNGNGF